MFDSTLLYSSTVQCSLLNNQLCNPKIHINSLAHGQVKYSGTCPTWQALKKVNVEPCTLSATKHIVQSKGGQTTKYSHSFAVTIILCNILVDWVWHRRACPLWLLADGRGEWYNLLPVAGACKGVRVDPLHI